MAKTHLRANKLTKFNVPVALCASKTINGKIYANLRQSYRYMASEIVGYDDYKNVASKDRCAHCDGGVSRYNDKRVALGLRSWDVTELAR